MKIKLKKSRLYINLILGLIWITIAIISLIYLDRYLWIDLAYLAVGLSFIAHCIYDIRNQYLIIDNGIIKKNVLYHFGKKIKLNDIIFIKKFAGVYTLRTREKQLKIDTSFIDDQSLKDLDKLLSELNLDPNNTPFTKAG